MSARKKSGRRYSRSKRKQVTVIGLGPRLLATIIDAAILLFLTIIVGVIAGLAAILLDWATPDRPLPVDRLLIVSMLATSILYYVAAWSRSGQTVGKALLGLRVVGRDGRPLSWGKALLRYTGYLVSGLALSVGFLWIAFDPTRQGWHDKFAGSYVVESDASFSNADAVRLVPADPNPGWVWLVAWLVVALIAPAALLTSLLIFGPAISAAVTGILSSLF